MRPSRRVPFIQQLEAADCGAACLAMVLAFNGRHVPLEDIRLLTGTTQGGTSALGLLQAARAYGMTGRGLRVAPEDCQQLPRGAILHWEGNHFVVLDGVRRGAVEVVDPASGRLAIPLEHFAKAFSGVVLLLEPGPEFQRAERRGSAYLRFAWDVYLRSGPLPRVLLLSVAYTLLMLAVPLLTGVLVNAVVPTRNLELLDVLGLGVLWAVGTAFLASLVRAHLLIRLNLSVDARMSVGLLQHLLGLPYGFFQRRSTGDLLMRLNNGTFVREVLVEGAMSGLLDGTFVLLYLAFLIPTSPVLALLSVGLASLKVLVFLLTARRRQELASLVLQQQARSQSYQVELLAGIHTVKAMGTEERMVSGWAGLFGEFLSALGSQARLSAWVDSTLSALRLAASLLILWVGTRLVVHGDMNLGTMLAANALAIGFLTPVTVLLRTGIQFQTLGSHVQRIDDIMQAPLEQRADAPHAGKLSGDIRLEQVSFRYGLLAPWVLQEVSVAIRPGQFVGIVGASGSGKSTLAQILVGLLLPEQGQVLHDGKALAELDLRSVREQVGAVTQRPYLFAGTIRNNIAFSDPSLPMEQIVEAAKLAHIHHEIEAMPMGYDTVLSDGGASLSGGQRQRLALARALVRRPSILLLDEATSELDTLSERKVQEHLATLGCTRIVIAHRLSTVVHADSILVIRDGCVAGQGTHGELLASNEAYSELVHAQVHMDEESVSGTA